MRIGTWMAAVTLLAFSTQAEAQQADAAARMEAAIEAAAEAQVPLSLIENKIQEGRSKGVSEARIASAVEARVNALVRAQSALQRAGASAVATGELALAADALQAGVSETAMVDVMTGAPAERRAAATAVLTELVELGVASDVALARVNAAVAAGGEALVSLPAQLSERAHARGNARVGVDVGPPAQVESGLNGGLGVGL